MNLLISLQNDTMRIIYMYHDEEPKRGSVVQGSLPNPKDALKQLRPLLLTQRVHHARLSNDTNNKIKVLEMRNQDVELPRYDETLYWCKMFKLNDIVRKHHIVKVSVLAIDKTIILINKNIFYFSMSQCLSQHPAFHSSTT